MNDSVGVLALAGLGGDTLIAWGGGDGDSEEVPYPQLKLMRQLLIEMAKQESRIKAAGKAAQNPGFGNVSRPRPT